MRVLRRCELTGDVVLACPEGLEPPTCCLEGSCSIQLSYGQPIQIQKRPDERADFAFNEMVGAAGFELATLCSQSSHVFYGKQQLSYESSNGYEL